ncbi:MAG TPA: hypothetical protein VFE24_04110 [Pirellulales bacterium]|jgi:Tfp pilus assembly PilM family ATPase/outer membrane murein-binding lipoprotein Lpp|nr:hypothetical protein [Pirellulales bacterium]
MSRLLALEWDDREARVAVATVRRGEALIEQAFNVTLHSERGEQTPAEIGGKLGTALSARGLHGKFETLVAVGRSSIELRHLQLPPAPDDELPDMVRFAALREFNTLGDDWPLDFFPTQGSATEARSVLAATISPELVSQIETTLQAASQRPERLILRACAAASLLRRTAKGGAETARVLVDLMTDEADLTVLEHETVVFLRTVRLPGEPGSVEQARALVAETRRTMVAAQNRLGGGRVEAAYLCGGEPAQQVLAEQMQAELNLPVQVLQPFSSVACSPELAANLPTNPGRFAPLLGVLLDEAAAVPHALDFLHPRKKPEPPNHRKLYLSVAAAVAAVAILVGGWIWFKLSSMDSQIASLQAESKRLEPDLKKAEELKKRMTVLDKWLVDDIDWLDEFKNLSAKFLDAKQAMLTSLLTLPSPTGGEIQLDGLLTDPSLATKLEQALRSPHHRVEAKGGEQSSNKQYQWHFKSSVMVER